MTGLWACSLPWGHRVISVQKVIENISGVQEINVETGRELEDSAQEASRKREGWDIRSCYWTSKDLRGTGQNRGQWVQASLMSQVVLSEPQEGGRSGGGCYDGEESGDPHGPAKTHTLLFIPHPVPGRKPGW